MKRKLLISLLLIVTLFVGLDIKALADSYSHYITFTVSDTGASDRTALPILTGISGQSLISSGYLNAAGNETSMQEAIVHKNYGVTTGNITLFIENLSSLQTRTYQIFTGYSPADTQKMIFGVGGYVTVADVASLEPGSNFTVPYSGYVDMSKSDIVVSKPSAFTLLTDNVTGNITASIYGTVNLIPKGAGAYTNITSVTGAATHWDAVNDPVGAPDDDTTYVSTLSAAYLKDTYTFTNTVTSNMTVDNVTVAWRVMNFTEGAGAVTPRLKLGGSESTGSEQVTTVGYANYSGVVARPGGGSWAVADFDTLEIGVDLKGNGAANSRATQVYATVAYHTGPTLALTSGEHTITARENGSNFWLTSESASSSNLTAISVPDTATNWQFGSDATPYINSLSVTVGGNQKLHFAPTSIISGTNLPDQSGNSNNGTITWGTNPPNITVSVGSITSYNPAIASASLSTTAPTVDILNQPGKWFTNNSTQFAGVLTPELMTVINNDETNIGMEHGVLLLLLSIGVATAIGLSVLLFTGSTILMIVAVGVTIMAGISANIFSGWFMAIYLLMAIPILYLSRQG